MAIKVELESLTTKSRLITPNYLDRNGEPALIGGTGKKQVVAILTPH
jgi:hypothetical protein